MISALRVCVCACMHVRVTTRHTLELDTVGVRHTARCPISWASDPLWISHELHAVRILQNWRNPFEGWAGFPHSDASPNVEGRQASRGDGESPASARLASLMVNFRPPHL